LRLVQERAAEREPLLHAARERAGPLVPRVPEAEALEQHADPLPALGHSVEAPVEVEVLDRGQLPVDERLVTGEADGLARRVDLELAGRRNGEARAEAEQRRLPGAVGAGD